MSANLWNLIGPVLLIGGFYTFLGGAVWLILRPRPWPLPRPATGRLTRLLGQVPVEPGVLRQALWLIAIGLVGLLIPAAGWFHLLAAQAIAAAVLLILLDQNQRRRDAAQTDRQLLAALRHPVASVAADALRQADAAGWLTNGALAGQELRRVQWPGARLGGADLRGSNLTGADLRAAELAAADLTGCVLDGACLEEANGSGASFEGASLVGTNAKDAVLIHADLSRANLQQARLSGADLTAAQLEQADLTGAGLKGACLDRARLTGARYDGATRWPKRFNPAAAGVLPAVNAISPRQLPEHLREPLR
jgi:uncharacterized protein YjbI with pentapeptide repeats